MISRLLFIALHCCTVHLGLAASVVLAPVVEVKGAASLVSAGAARSQTLRTGESLAEGNLITTGADDRAVFSLLPGAAVSEGRGTSVSQIRLINLIARTTTDFSADGTRLATRDAKVQELESGRGLFEATLAHVAMAAGYGLFSSEAMAEITLILTKINQPFATVGLAPLNAAAVGASTPTLLPLAVTKRRGAIRNRDVLLKLDSGTLSFSLDKGSASTTNFVVQTPSGTLSAEHSAGTIAVAGSFMKLASLSGKMTYTATGSQAAIQIAPGSFLVASGEGANVIAGSAPESAPAPAGITSGSANPANLSGPVVSPER